MGFPRTRWEALMCSVFWFRALSYYLVNSHATRVVGVFSTNIGPQNFRIIFANQLRQTAKPITKQNVTYWQYVTDHWADYQAENLSAWQIPSIFSSKPCGTASVCSIFKLTDKWQQNRLIGLLPTKYATFCSKGRKGCFLRYFSPWFWSATLYSVPHYWERPRDMFHVRVFLWFRFSWHSNSYLSRNAKSSHRTPSLPHWLPSRDSLSPRSGEESAIEQANCDLDLSEVFSSVYFHRSDMMPIFDTLWTYCLMNE